MDRVFLDANVLFSAAYRKCAFNIVMAVVRPLRGRGAYALLVRRRCRRLLELNASGVEFAIMARMHESPLFAANGLNDVPDWWLGMLIVGGFLFACGLVAALAWFINRRFK